MLIGINLFYRGKLQKSSKLSMSSVSKYWRVLMNLGEYLIWVLFRGEKSPFPTVDLQTVKNILSAVSKDEDSCLLMVLLKENPDFLSSFISISDTIPKGLNWVSGVFMTYFSNNLGEEDATFLFSSPFGSISLMFISFRKFSSSNVMSSLS